jgi:3-oxoacyl-[acyl-carrier protein] reductase
MTLGNPDPPLTVIVTGGARGLGYEMAHALLQSGARVLITSARRAAELQQATEKLRQAVPGAEVEGLVANASNWADCELTATTCLTRWGRIDGLVNNAGRGMREISDSFNVKPVHFWDASPEALQEIVTANVMSTMLMARACLPQMVAQGFGRMVNLSTNSVTMTRRGFTPYGAAKAAVEAMSVAWASELSETGVKVNVLLPGGATDTEFIPGEGSARKGADGQLLSPRLMRRPIVWLMSRECTSTGQRYIAKDWPENIPVDLGAKQANTACGTLPQIL